MKSVYIVPTGEEIREGVVLDLDSIEIMNQLLRFDPGVNVTRISPLPDDETQIFQVVQELTERGPSLIVLIGGSGGGHRHSKSLGKDYTHSALERIMNVCAKHEIYGKNGHMWTKLLCGKKNGTIIINVPGPFVEAEAAFRAFLNGVKQDLPLDAVARAMAEAVLKQYPSGATLPL